MASFTENAPRIDGSFPSLLDIWFRGAVELCTPILIFKRQVLIFTALDFLDDCTIRI